jgi:hypothetical protein
MGQSLGRSSESRPAQPAGNRNSATSRHRDRKCLSADRRQQTTRPVRRLAAHAGVAALSGAASGREPVPRRPPWALALRRTAAAWCGELPRTHSAPAFCCWARSSPRCRVRGYAPQARSALGASLKLLTAWSRPRSRPRTCLRVLCRPAGFLCLRGVRESRVLRSLRRLEPEVAPRSGPQHKWPAGLGGLAVRSWRNASSTPTAGRNGERHHDFAEWPSRFSTTRHGFGARLPVLTSCLTVR